ncbi:MAG TPA: hypothetical protein VH558_05640 [Pseudolabrys sp.]|jgi:molybdopterin/thiamine biosynthesis adenylyltransferase
MDRQKWLDERDSRTLRYSDRRLDPDRWIAIAADAEYAGTYEGQVAIIVAANLLGRMTPSVAIAVPNILLQTPLPWAGRWLHEFVLAQMKDADRDGQFTARASVTTDVVLHLGPRDHETLAHGVGWDTYLGPAPSPLKVANTAPNPFGAALAAILSVGRLFVHELSPPPLQFVCNTLNWKAQPAPADALPPTRDDLGCLWFIGLGSVGTAAAYFLTLINREFSAALFDMDDVKVHNLDRSPIFSAADAERKVRKVLSAKAYLRSVGVDDVIGEPKALDESVLWRNRQDGTPDVLISAANERNARPIIEGGFPPPQLYATTGKNFQTALFRHVPLKDPCSVCMFPSQSAQPQARCATGEVTDRVGDREMKVDAALPFLSFAAGLMTAAELTKLQHPNYPYSSNRVFLQTRPEPTLIAVPMSRRHGCACAARNMRIHRKMLKGSRYERFSFH